MDCHQTKSVISHVDSLVRSAHATSQSSGQLLVLRCEKVFIQFAHCYCFSVGLRSKRFRVVSEQRETEERSVTGFSVWAARKMERAAIFLAVFDPHSSFFALKSHANARLIRVLLFSAQKWPLLIASRSWQRFTKRRNDGQRRKAAVFCCKEFIFLSLRNILRSVTGVRCGDGAKRCDPKKQQSQVKSSQSLFKHGKIHQEFKKLKIT